MFWHSQNVLNMKLSLRTNTVSHWYTFLGIFWIVPYSVHCLCFHLVLVCRVSIWDHGKCFLVEVPTAIGYGECEGTGKICFLESKALWESLLDNCCLLTQNFFYKKLANVNKKLCQNKHLEVLWTYSFIVPNPLQMKSVLWHWVCYSSNVFLLFTKLLSKYRTL